jgi:predicted nuclease of predicted toxin-antitoxin system
LRFLLDESVDVRLRAFLASRGHDVTAVALDYQPALSDEDVLALSVSEERTLITNDKDFGDLVFHRGLRHAGVIPSQAATAREPRETLRAGPY